ncbi:MAG TPA: NAD(P)-dependent oxidoreductase, partial [Caldilinea sp.]|nr:NAD(P)-dependent oxidoreductase [Caldilinea sp.]
MRVLITAANGKLGAYVIRALARDHDLVLFARHQPGAEFDGLPWVQGDITSLDDCRRALQGIDALQHLAAQPWPTDHPQMREQAAAAGLAIDTTFRANMVGVYNLLQAAVEANVRTVVMAGSNCVLGHGYRISAAPFPHAFLPIDETHPTWPEDSYSFTKRAGEDLLASYTRAYGIRTYVTRIAGICPPAQRRRMLAEATPTTTWSPWLWGWVGSEDVASAHRLLMEQADELPPHDVYFLNADDTTALEPTRHLIERFRPDLLPLVRELDGHASLITCTKLKAATGWRHQTT